MQNLVSKKENCFSFFVANFSCVYENSIGDEVDALTPPEINLQGFLHDLDAQVQLPKYQVWCPKRNALRPWIRVKYALKVYKESQSSCTLS